MTKKEELKQKEKWVWNLFTHILRNFTGTAQDGNPRESYLTALNGDPIKIRSYLNYPFCVKIDISVQTKNEIIDVIGKVLHEINDED